MLSTSLGALFPDGVVVAELRGEGDASLLMPAESSHLARAVPKRVKEFAAGRQCARRALAEFGIPHGPLQVAADRRPVWPAGVVGSITHTEGFCAAAVAEECRFAALGIDSESARAVKPELRNAICRPAEIAWLETLPQADRTAAATLIFSAKEAFYKCQYPLTEQFLWFHDVEVQIRGWGEARGEFAVSAAKAIALAQLSPLPLRGQYLMHQQFMSTAVCMPR
jgi:4'-phosphopantetheinyl transferase EntD